MNESSNRWFPACFFSSKLLVSASVRHPGFYLPMWEPQRRSKYTWVKRCQPVFPTLSDPVLRNSGHAFNNDDRFENMVCKSKVQHINAKINKNLNFVNVISTNTPQCFHSVKTWDVLSKNTHEYWPDLSWWCTKVHFSCKEHQLNDVCFYCWGLPVPYPVI